MKILYLIIIKNLIKLRKQYPALIEGDYEELLSYSPGIYAYARTTKDKSERIIVIANTTAKNSRL